MLISYCLPAVGPELYRIFDDLTAFLIDPLDPLYNLPRFSRQILGVRSNAFTDPFCGMPGILLPARERDAHSDRHSNSYSDPYLRPTVHEFFRHHSASAFILN